MSAHSLYASQEIWSLTAHASLVKLISSSFEQAIGLLPEDSRALQTASSAPPFSSASKMSRNYLAELPPSEQP